ncbi:MAG: SUMF1/EgtB/PvdO family nonheme iron enzyme [Spirulina sp.]
MGPAEATVPETWYEFREGIRELLLENSPVQRTAEIWRKIGDFIQQHYGSPRDFQALIPNPTGSIEDTAADRDLYFAEVEAAVLMTWGGEYASRAQELRAAVATRKREKNKIDYTHLENLLAAQQWKEADLETANIMLKATNREQRGWLEAVDLQQLPSDALQILDRLWVESSRGHFGFSVQKQIWLSVGGQPGQKDDEIYKQFGNRVGWYIRNRDYWLLWDEHTFSLEAPQGHLPQYLPSQEQRIRPYLFSRQDLWSRTEANLSSLESFEFEAEVATIVFEPETSEKKKKLKTILLVEDKSAIVEEVSELLSSHYGIIVRGTEDVNEVIDLAQSDDIDLILINDHLPNSRYQGKGVNGIDIVRLLRDELNISRYLPIIGFSYNTSRNKEFLRYADGFYDKNKVRNEGAEQDFINYLRKIFNRVKLLELLPYESAEDLDSVLEFISKRNLESRDTSEEDVSSLWNKPKGDDGTFYLLENLRLLDVLVMTASGKGAGTVRYDLSPSYLNQNSPRRYPPPDGDEFDERLQQLPPGQRDLLDLIKQRSELKQDTSLADAAVRFNHPEDTYRRLENLRLLGFLSITDLGTSRETISYNLSQKYQKYLGFKKGLDLQVFEFKSPTVNRRGETIKTKTHTASYFNETLTDSVGLEMVAIPGGTFTMGSRENEGYDRERPQHQVTVSPFFMGKYPVTQAQWQAIASRTELKVEIDLELDPSKFKGDNRPVETVNWYEAVEFCQRLSKLTRRDYRLPSEAEWEYACRGVTEPLNREIGESYPPFYFGETITGKLANYDASRTYADEPKGEESKKTTPVGQFPPNAFGLYDMNGNVWEWCADDWHYNYEDAPTDGSAWLDSNEGENINDENKSYSDNNDENESYSLLRGGSWFADPNLCRSAAHLLNFRRVVRYDAYGFRVVCGFGRTL